MHKLPPIFKYIACVIAVILAWQFLIKPVLRNMKGFDEIEWRGAKFRLKHKYLDYEEYKSGIDQLASGEVERLKQFMLAISLALFLPFLRAFVVKNPDLLLQLATFVVMYARFSRP